VVAARKGHDEVARPLQRRRDAHAGAAARGRREQRGAAAEEERAAAILVLVNVYLRKEVQNRVFEKGRVGRGDGVPELRGAAGVQVVDAAEVVV
jgi:hypothetical protein